MTIDGFPTPPEIYQQFVERYPQLEKAWETLSEAGREGPLEPKTLRLVKLGIAIGAMREGAIRANVRKAIALMEYPAMHKGSTGINFRNPPERGL
jgi:hypothetical protein